MALTLVLMLPAATSAGAEVVAQPELRKFSGYVQKIPGTVVRFELLPVPAGRVEARDSKNAEPRIVDVKPFWIGKTEVTWDEFDIFAFALDAPTKEARHQFLSEGKTRPSYVYSDPRLGFGHHRYPAICVSRYAATMYCNWLTEKTGRRYRLPTPEEWQWACAAGRKTPPTRQEIDAAAWHRENCVIDYDWPDGKTHPVGTKQPNAFGLQDMLGNVAEWVLREGEDPAHKPVAAGGSWQSLPHLLHGGYRQTQTERWQITDPQHPKSRWWLTDGGFVGFRVVCDDVPFGATNNRN